MLERRLHLGKECIDYEELCHNNHTGRRHIPEYLPSTPERHRQDPYNRRHGMEFLHLWCPSHRRKQCDCKDKGQSHLLVDLRHTVVLSNWKAKVIPVSLNPSC
jgi:hypothetical protein